MRRFPTQPHHLLMNPREHAADMQALEVSPGKVQYPGISEDPLDAFRHLAHDLERFATEFVAGDAGVLLGQAPLDARKRDQQLRREMAKAVGDDALRREAQHLFRSAEYAAALAAFDSVRYPEFLTASEHKAIALAHARKSTL